MVTAAPKFLNLQDDAKVIAVKGLAGAMKGAAGITYGKAAVAGEESKETGYITVDGVSTAVKYGYPTNATLADVVDGLDTDWVKNPTLPSDMTTSAAVYYGYEGFGCIATYTEAADQNTPAVIAVEGTAANCVVDNN